MTNVFFDLWKITHLKEMLENVKFKQIRLVEWIKTNPQAVSVLTVMLGAVNFALRVVTDRAIDGIFRSPEDD